MTAVLTALVVAYLQLAAGPVGGWPLQPVPAVVEGFDPPVSTWGAGHRGVDLRGSPGQVVHAAEAGTVRFVGRIAGRGIVVVDHGGTRTTYEPVRASVAVGESVSSGAPLGRLELFGSHCFPAACLHWGLIAGRDTYLDPLTLVGAGPVRLLPLDGPAADDATLDGPALDAGRRPVAAAGSSWVRGSGALFRPGQARGWAWR
jgi:murein DD-endopeptidase MepM/ murein hydrolase activator NlpD